MEHYHRDIKNILHYISHDLGSPSTALELFDEVENSLSLLSTLPYRFNLSDGAYLNIKGKIATTPIRCSGYFKNYFTHIPTLSKYYLATLSNSYLYQMVYTPFQSAYYYKVLYYLQQ